MEVDCLDAAGAAERLDEDGVDSQAVETVDEEADIGVELSRVGGVVDAVDIDPGGPHGRIFVALALQEKGELGCVGVLADHTAPCFQEAFFAADGVDAAAESEKGFEALPTALFDAGQGVLAVRPDQNLGLMTELTLEDGLGFRQVAGDAAAVAFEAFVLAIVADERGPCFAPVAENIGGDRMMEVMGVGGDGYQPGRFHLPDLLPVDQRADVGRFTTLQPGCYHRQSGGKLVFFQQRENFVVKGYIAVVEREEHRLVRQGGAGGVGVEILLQRYGVVAVMPEKVEVGCQGGGADSVIVVHLADIVVAENENSVARDCRRRNK